MSLLLNSAVYLGQVATRCFLPGAALVAGTATWTKSRNPHFARDKIVNPTVVYPNFYINSSNSEVTIGAATLKAYIEYPVGTFTLANECIADGGSVALPNGLTPLTFAITIPRGKRFRTVQMVYGAANGVLYRQFSSVFCTFSDDQFAFGTGGAPTDDLTTRNWASDERLFTYGPMLILSSTRQPSVAISGTSREFNGQGGISDINGDIGVTARAVGERFGYASFAIENTRLDQYLSGTRTYRDQLLTGNVPGLTANAPYFSHISTEFGVNDVAAGRTAAQVLADRVTFAALYAGSVVVGETIYPYVNSSDQFQTTANQSITTNQVKITAVNDGIRAGIVGESFVWDVADSVDPFRKQIYPVNRDPSAAAVPNTTAFTASLSGTTLTVSAISVGALKVGDTVTDTAATAAAGTRILGQLTGTAGSTGTYQVSRLHSGYPYPSAVTSTTWVASSPVIRDGLHLTDAGEEQAAKAINLDLLMAA